MNSPSFNLGLDEYFQHKQKRGEFFIKYWNYKSPECIFSGYAPNGPIAKIEDIKPSKATLDAGKGIKALLGKAGTKVGKRKIFHFYHETSFHQGISF